MPHPIQVPSEIVQKWQDLVDLLAEIIQVPSALIMRVEPPNIKVFVSSESKGNPYERGEAACLNTGLYCETVMKTRQSLLVRDALADEDWKSNPDIKLGMISYLGFPISWPDGEIFGTVCVLDNKKNEYSELYRKLLLQYRDVLQADLRSVTAVHTELATQKAQLEELFMRVPEAIAVVDGRGEVVRINPEFTGIFGFAESEVLGRSLNDLIVPEDLRAEARKITRQRNETGNLSFETVRTRKDGTRVPVSVIRVPVHSMNDDSRIAEYVVYRDISGRKRAEAEQRYYTQLLKTATDNASPMVFIVDLAGRGTFVNPSLERITGYRAEELIGEVVHDKIHHIRPDGTPYPVSECPLTGAVRQGKIVRGEDLFVRRDGSFFPVRCTASPIFRDGVPVGSFVEALDLTQIKAAEQELRNQADLLNLANDAIIVRDPESRITFWNSGAEKKYGWTAAEALGRVSHDLLQSRFPDSREAVDIALHERGEWEGELTHITRDGKTIIVTSRQSLRRDEHGAAAMILEINRNITESKRAEEALRKIQAELAHVARVATLGELTASIAHELNQPLGAIVNNGSAALRWLAAQKIPEAVKSVKRAIEDGHRAGEIIRRIRSFALKAPPQKDWLDINGTVREVVALARNEAQNNGVSIESKLASDLSPVFGDRIQLQQVILNLVMNAIEAMSEVSEHPHKLLIVSEKDGSSRCRIGVQDSGPGVGPERLDQIFTPFYTTKPQGMGMGLAICRSIVEAHDGKLWATPNEDRGATFQFTLPVHTEAGSGSRARGTADRPE